MELAHCRALWGGDWVGGECVECVGAGLDLGGVVVMVCGNNLRYNGNIVRLEKKIVW